MGKLTMCDVVIALVIGALSGAAVAVISIAIGTPHVIGGAIAASMMSTITFLVLRKYG